MSLIGRDDSHNTKTPLTQWFLGGLSDEHGQAWRLGQRQLGLRRYETAWMMLHKLRRAQDVAANG